MKEGTVKQRLGGGGLPPGRGGGGGGGGRQGGRGFGIALYGGGVGKDIRFKAPLLQACQGTIDLFHLSRLGHRREERVVISYRNRHLPSFLPSLVLVILFFEGVHEEEGLLPFAPDSEGGEDAGVGIAVEGNLVLFPHVLVEEGRDGFPL